MHYLIGVDAGSTGIKAIALLNGQIASQVHAPMIYRRLENVWEYDALEYYETISQLICRLVSDMRPGSICDGITMVCASGNALLLKNGAPLAPVISWMDGRGARDLDLLFPNETEQSIHEAVGWHKAPKFPLAQLSHIRRHDPLLLDRADMICECASYVNYRLCGNWAMDHSTGTTFYLQDQRTFSWNASMLRTLGIPAHKLPPLVPVGARIGTVTEKASCETALPAGTPVIIGCYDGAAAARSAGITDEGQMLISCGTSWVCAYPSKSREYLLKLGTMIDPYLESEGLWIGMTSLGEIGVIAEEILAGLLPDSGDRIADFNALSEASVPGAHGLLINPMRLDWRKNLPDYPLSDICRALMEGIVYSVKRQRDALPGDLSHIRRISMVGGPSNSPIWPQILCDVMHLPLCVSNGPNASAVGAAIIAGIGSGAFAGLSDALRRTADGNKRFYLPSQEADTFYPNCYNAFVQKFPGLDDNMH